MAEKEILIVEDDPRWQNDLKEILEERGYQVHIASNYGEAEAALKYWPAKAAVIDLSLRLGDAEDRQGRNIMELAKMKVAKIPVVCISGYVSTPREAIDIISKKLAGWFFDKREFEDKKEQFLEVVAIALVESEDEIHKKWIAIEEYYRSGG
jgi:DNA-binding NtrC family response regulator